MFSWPSFGDLIPSFLRPTAGINLEVIQLNNESASINCSWTGGETANLSWTVDQAPPADGMKVEEDGGSSLLVLDWISLGKKGGDVVLVACAGRAAGNNTETGAWATAAQMMETLRVPQSNEDENDIDDDDAKDNDDKDKDDGDDKDDDEKDKEEDDDGGDNK